MHKLIRLEKTEKMVLLVGVVMIVALIVLGIAKDRFVKKEVYVPVDTTSAKVTRKNTEVSTSDGLKLKKETFMVNLGSTLQKETSIYFDNTSDELENVKLDFSKVDTKNIGTYEVNVTNGKSTSTFPIVVVESVDPTFTVGHASVIFYLEDNSTIDEVKTYAAVVAKDALGNDISDSIKGWAKEVPKTAQTVTYKLTVSDDDGNSATTSVAVQYIIKTA